MKLKIALIAATLALTGCQMPQGPIYNATDTNKIITKAERAAYDGDMQWRNGTGLTYTRKPNQCGKNCGAHAELAAKLDAEKAAREAAGNPEYERIVAREKEAYRRAGNQEKCYNAFTLKLAAAQDQWQYAIKKYGFNSKKTRALAEDIEQAQTNALTLINKCTDKLNALDSQSN